MGLDGDVVAEVDAALDLYHHLQPVNADEERAAFMDAVADDDTYNPSYRYPGFEEEDAVRNRLEALDDAAETRLEGSVVTALRSRLRIITAIGDQEITAASRQHYGSPVSELVGAAEEQFVPPGDDRERTVQAGTVTAAFNALFDRLDMDYTASRGDNDIIRSSPHEARILVPREKSYTVDAAKRLLVHESTHAVRAVNGRASGNPALVYGTTGYEAAEEGLATFNEAALDVLQVSLPKITARVLAVDRSDRSFHALYQSMRDLGLDARAAFVRTYRVKRGLRDTSEAGGFIKDHIYFDGYRQISEDPALADRLYRGKTGFDDVDAVDTEPQISRPEHITACTAVGEELLA
ncbi:MAG: DUF1704 domain-containing protein [Candidatus Nanohaloarchaea archaeon]|nr:DUF1704 domain-containing protein [Candidatus Nanohaloarchaea archaeon]